MYLLIDRATGAVLAEASNADFDVLQEHLCRESETDYDFYLNDATLDYLIDCGLSSEIAEQVRPRLGVRGLDMGWERARTEFEALYSGRVVDQDDKPLGGIRIDLLERVTEDTHEPDNTLDIIDWCYSREDGTFRVGLDRDLPGAAWRACGRGNLELQLEEIEELGDLGEISVTVLSGRVVLADGTPVEGLSVQLVRYKCLATHGEVGKSDLRDGLTWGDSDAEGNFYIPVRFADTIDEVKLQLEVLAVSGETLCELEVELRVSQTLSLGSLTVPTPDEHFGEEELMVAAEES